jgi:hypothetical protein
MVLSLGSLLADVSHSRPVNIIGTATDQDLIERYNLQRSRYQGPTGIVGVMQHTFSSAGFPTMSFWAAVPAYASQVPSPKASLALIERACDVIGTPVPTGVLADEVGEYEDRVDQFVEQDRDLVGYVRRLESLSDAGLDIDEDDDFEDDDFEDDDDDEDDTVGGEAVEALGEVTPERLIEEVEQFLRDQGQS